MTDTAPAAPAATVARALLGSATRHLLTAAGTALVTRGIVDQGTVDGVMPMAVEIVVGAALATFSTGWGQFRAFASHTRWARAWAALRTANP